MWYLKLAWRSKRGALVDLGFQCFIDFVNSMPSNCRAPTENIVYIPTAQSKIYLTGRSNF